MKIKKLGVALIGAAVLLSGCSAGATQVPEAGEESTQEACPEGHWQDDWEWKKKGKKKKLVNDRDWICDVPPVHQPMSPAAGPIQFYSDHWGDDTKNV